MKTIHQYAALAALIGLTQAQDDNAGDESITYVNPFQSTTVTNRLVTTLDLPPTSEVVPSSIASLDPVSYISSQQQTATNTNIGEVTTLTATTPYISYYNPVQSTWVTNPVVTTFDLPPPSATSVASVDAPPDSDPTWHIPIRPSGYNGTTVATSAPAPTGTGAGAEDAEPAPFDGGVGKVGVAGGALAAVVGVVAVFGLW
ncbi:hypothetical protein MBLNU230_g7307t1 [Neophaeotheca triangularis]